MKRRARAVFPQPEGPRTIVDPPLGRGAPQERVAAVRREQQRRLAQRPDRDPLVLGREEGAERREARVRRGLAALACGQQFGLPCKLPERLMARGVAHEHDAHAEHEPDRDEHRDGNRREHPGAEAAEVHGRLAPSTGYPATAL